MCFRRTDGKFSYVDSNFREGMRFKSYRMANRLHEMFVAKYGTSICSGIHQFVMGRSYRLSNPNEWEQFLKAGGHSDKCPAVVGRAARWTAQLLIEEAEASGNAFQFSGFTRNCR